MASIHDAPRSDRSDPHLVELQSLTVELADELERRALRFEKVLTERNPHAALAARELAQDFLLLGIELVGATRVSPSLTSRFAELVDRGAVFLPDVFEKIVALTETEVDAGPPSTRSPLSQGQASLEAAALRQQAARVAPLRLERVEVNTIPVRGYSETSLPTLRPEEHAVVRSGLRLLWGGVKLDPDAVSEPPPATPGGDDDDDVSLEVSFAEIGPISEPPDADEPPHIKSA